MGSSVTSARVTGALLVERGLVTPAQLAEALEHQRANGGDLEDVLQYLHGVTPEQIATVVGEYRRREISVDVGSLLIAAGAVAEGALEEARRRSADSGQPLGPILVEMGAITRLELASALAEQWSDTPAQILPPPGAAEREPGASAEDVQDLRFAMRALEASVRAEREHEVGEDALEEIQRREDVLAARVAALEIAIEQPIEVDPALAEELHATAERLSAMQTSLGELARAEDVAALGAALRELDEVRATVALLGERQAQLAPAEALQVALDDLTRLSERVDGVVAAVDEVVERTDLAALREAVDALAARPPGDPELAQRVEGLVRELGSLSVLAEASSGADGLQEAIGELAQRIDAAADAAAAAGVELDELRPLVDRVEAARVDAERATRELADLRRVVEELAQLPARVGALESAAPRLDEVDAALDRLAAELTQLRELPAADALLAERLDALALDVAALAERLAPLDALPEAVGAAASRVAAVEGLQEDLERLRGAVVALEERGAPDPELGERLARLADRVESLSIDALGPAAEAAVAGVVGRVDELAARQLVTDERADTLRARLEDLQGAVAALAARDARAPELDSGTRALEASLAELRLRLDGTAPASTVASLLVAVEELQVAVEPLRMLDGRFESVERRLAAAESRAGEAARASDGAIGAVKEQLDAMAERTEARLAAVLERLDAIEPDAGAAVAADAGGDLRDEVAALGTAVESLRQGLAREIERMEHAWAAERQALTERVAAAGAATTTGADERGAAPTSAPGVPDADLARLARELERLTDRVSEQERSLVEHFARRERALVERLGAGTDVGQRLAELTRRIEEVRVRVEKVSAGSAGSGASGEDVTALKEALFARLERLASSVDWRFQRLEGGPAAAAERADLHTRMDELTSLVATLAGGQTEAPTEVRPPSGAVGVFLALVPSPSGHQLVEVSGAVPQAGERIVDPLGSGALHVVAVGTSPLPGDGRPCVFVEPAEVGSAVAPEAPTAA